MPFFRQTVCVLALSLAGTVARADTPPTRGLDEVPHDRVELRGGFWGPRLKTHREVTVPHALDCLEKDGHVTNFDKAAGRATGPVSGHAAFDSDLYKALEGAVDCLQHENEPGLRQRVEGILERVLAAQQKDGFLIAYFILQQQDQRWDELRLMHQMYNAGHFFEMAVEHARLSGDPKVLNAAKRFADHIDGSFGPGKRYDVDGHQEVELALVRLYRATGQKRYLDLAKFFLDERGYAHGTERKPFDPKAPMPPPPKPSAPLTEAELRREKFRAQLRIRNGRMQDHKPIIQQHEAVGHAVRAGYMYAAMADLVRFGDAPGYEQALDHLWRDVLNCKMYVTGNIGTGQYDDEGFGDPYLLPNDSAYCESCAAIAHVLWQHRMALLHAQAKYADVMELALYNGVLSGISISGDRFFYQNPLAAGKKGGKRKPWIGLSCCPTNLARIIPQVGGMAYARGKGRVYVNLYAAGELTLKTDGGATLKLAQQTNYPWDGRVRLSVAPDQASAFTLCLRIPGWALGRPVPSDLYRFAEPKAPLAGLKVNGQAVACSPREDGYVHLERRWQTGDVVELDLPMPIQRVLAHEKVKDDQGKVALMRGPLVYCFEAADQPCANLSRLVLPREAELCAEHRPDLLGGVTVIEATAPAGTERPLRVTAIPYYAWANRQPGPMAVWVKAAEKSPGLFPGRMISLDGAWEIAEGPMEKAPSDFAHKVPVPGLVDMAQPAFEEVGVKSKRREAFWYRRRFRVEGPLPAVALLKVHRAMFGARVLLNGITLGDHLPCFTPGRFDAKAALKEGDNEILIRVGAFRENIPRPIPAGWDDEKKKYIPGIFDSVELILTGSPHTVRVQAVPDIEKKSVTMHAWVRTTGPAAATRLDFTVREAASGLIAGEGVCELPAENSGTERAVQTTIALPNCRLWSPEAPFLYEVEVGSPGDTLTTRFGMRSFRLDPATGRAILNGKPYFMRGSNITLYRFFEDPERGDKPWREEWVRRLHNACRGMHWNSLRYCIGFPPEAWYRIADEEGILIQDEFPIWNMKPKAGDFNGEELAQEFTEWMEQRWNHPCVVLWDACNETRSKDIAAAIQKVRGLDFSNRPWDNGWGNAGRPSDSSEQHPYHFFDAKFKLSGIAKDPGTLGWKPGKNPIIVNEYGWLWLNRDGTPTTLTKDLYRNLLGPDSTTAQRRNLYARYLAAETEFWRSHRAMAGVLHFCALGYSRPDGQTSDHWLDLEKLTWEPEFLQYVRDSFAPVGLMIDYWAEEHPAGTVLKLPVAVINDLDREWRGTVKLRLASDGRTIAEKTLPGRVPALGREVYSFDVAVPDGPAKCQLIAELHLSDGQSVRSVREFRAVPAAATAPGNTPLLPADKLRQYAQTFNQHDQELYPQHVSNAAAARFLEDNVPRLDCPDKEIEEIYHFRWWTYRKHVKQTRDGFIITEFLPRVGWAGKHNSISCAAGHHIYEGRWLCDPKYLDDYALFWFRKGGDPRHYSFWAADALWARFLATGDDRPLKELLPDLTANYEAWEKSNLDPSGLFWQNDGADGGEMSIGGHGLRPTINSYMYGDAAAIAKMAERFGRKDLADRFRAKARRLKQLTEERLWDPKAEFFKILARGNHAKPSDVRELYGYSPWYFNLPDADKANAWKQLMDPQGFYAPFGPTTAEQRHPKFTIAYQGHECQWNGPSWPYGTAVTLTAMANLLSGPAQGAVSRKDYFELLKIYTKSHRLTRADGKTVPWIDENLNPRTGDWIARTLLQQRRQGPSERGKDYNHSTYCDLVITGLLGLRPRPDDVVEVNPLLPEGTWDWFCLDRVPYHGRMLTVLYDKTGERYGRGKGLRVFVNGQAIAEADALRRLTAPLPPRP